MTPRGVLETSLYVSDLAAAERFYVGILGLGLDSRQSGRHVFLRTGNQMLLLFRSEESEVSQSDIPPHGARGPGHVAFACRDDEIDAWRSHLQSHGVAIEHEQTWPAGARSIYFRDPSGNSVELASPRIWGLEEPS